MPSHYLEDPCVDDFVEHFSVTADGLLLGRHAGRPLHFPQLNRDYPREWLASQAQRRERLLAMAALVREVTAPLVRRRLSGSNC